MRLEKWSIRYSSAGYCKSFDIYSGETGNHFTAGPSRVDVTWSHILCKKIILAALLRIN